MELLSPAFFLGLALGIIVIGFLAIGSFERGYDHAVRAPFRAELRARHPIARRSVTARLDDELERRHTA